MHSLNTLGPKEPGEAPRRLLVRAAQTLTITPWFSPVEAIYLLTQAAVPFHVGGGIEEKEGGNCSVKAEDAQSEALGLSHTHISTGDQALLLTELQLEPIWILEPTSPARNGPPDTQ